MGVLSSLGGVARQYDVEEEKSKEEEVAAVSRLFSFFHRAGRRDGGLTGCTTLNRKAQGLGRDQHLPSRLLFYEYSVPVQIQHMSVQVSYGYLYLHK